MPLPLKLSAPELLQSGTFNYTTLSSLRDARAPGFTLNADGNTVYNYAGNGDYDFLITTDGLPGYTSRLTGEVRFKVRLHADRNYAGFVILEDLGRNCSFSTSGSRPPDAWEYSYGSLKYDGEPEGTADYPYTAGQRTRVGCLVNFIFWNGVCYPQIYGYAQQIDATGYDVEVIPGYGDASSSYEGTGVDLPEGSFVPAFGDDEDETYVEFVFNTSTRTLEVWGINPAGFRIAQIYPGLTASGDVTAINAYLTEYVTVGTPVAGHVRTRGTNISSGFEVLSTDPSEPDCIPAITGAFGGEGAYAQATFPSLHRYPPQLPAFEVAGHTFEDVGVSEDFAFERGEDRARQIYTFNPQVVSVSVEFSDAEFSDFSTWYEGEILAGGARFDVEVASQAGTGVAWWTAQFVGPYKWEAFGWYFVLSAQLLLLDGPHDTRTAPGLMGRTSSSFSLRGSLPSGWVLEGRTLMTTDLTALSVPQVYLLESEEGLQRFNEETVARAPE